MDRGRCGYDLVSNKFLREQALAHKREVHLDRLKKIKCREPGSSSTLDNTVPESLKSKRIANNPRKRSKQTEKNISIERQNKVLLQRISTILTAPPKITDKEYQKMQKLINSINQNEKFSAGIQKKRNKQFFDRVKKTGAYYNAKEWELDYKKQLHGQKFMRQVTYTRPKDWVDPFAEVPKEVKPKRGMNREPTTISTTGRRSGSSTNGSHVSRVKSLRAGNYRDDKTTDDCNATEVEKQSTCSSHGSVGFDRDDFTGSGGNSSSLSSRLLASVERTIHVSVLHPECGKADGAEGQDGKHRPLTTDFGSSGLNRESFNMTSNSLPSLHSHTIEAFGSTGDDSLNGTCDKINEAAVSIFCSLVDDRVLFITVDSVDEDRVLHAEAQIDCNELMIVDIDNGADLTDPPTFPVDLEAQETLAFDLINEITLCVEPGSSDYEIVLPDPNRLGDEFHEPQAADEVTVEKAKKILEVFDPVNYSCGVLVPVEFVQPRVIEKESNKPTTLRKQKTNPSYHETKVYSPEKIHMLFKIIRTGEEKAVIRGHVVRNSVNKSKPNMPAISADTTMELVISLPSILAIEHELVFEYFQNAASNLRVHHNTATGSNTLQLGE